MIENNMSSKYIFVWFSTLALLQEQLSQTIYFSFLILESS